MQGSLRSADKLLTDPPHFPMVILKRFHMIAVIVSVIMGSFVVPLIVSVSAYYKSIQATNQKIDDFKLESEKTYAHTTDIKAVNEKLDKISQDTAAIKGYLKGRDHLPPSN